MTLPYQIQRTRIAEHGDIVFYRFDLVNLATGKVLARALSAKPTVSERLGRRCRELNKPHTWKVIEFNEFREG